MARNYNTSTLVYVPLGTLKYTFLSRLKDSFQNNLGQKPITSALTDVTGVIVGANAPKPPTASKRTPLGTVSSFCDPSKAADLKGDGWKVQAPKFASYSPKGADDPGLSVTYVISINGVNYAYNAADIPEGVDIPEGIEGVLNPYTDQTTLVWGASFPKPPKLTIISPKGKRFSTFVDPSKKEAVKALGGTTQGGAYSAEFFNAKYLGIYDSTPSGAGAGAA